MANKKKTPSSKKKTTTKTTTTTTVTTTTTTIVDKNLDTHYLLILDRSYSMCNCWDATISGLNEQLGTIRHLEEKYPEQRYFVSLVVFDTEIETILEDESIGKIKDFDGTEFPPRGATALHDAMGIGISNLKATIKKNEKDNDSISTAIVVVMTDGEENSSHEYNAKSIKEIIGGLEESGAWTFTYMGANQDAVLAASAYGIGVGNSITYTSSSKGAETAFKTLNRAFEGKAATSNATYMACSALGEVTLDSMQMDNSTFLSDVVEGGEIGEDDSNLKETEDKV